MCSVGYAPFELLRMKRTRSLSIGMQQRPALLRQRLPRKVLASLEKKVYEEPMTDTVCRIRISQSIPPKNIKNINKQTTKFRHHSDLSLTIFDKRKAFITFVFLPSHMFLLEIKTQHLENLTCAVTNWIIIRPHLAL